MLQRDAICKPIKEHCQKMIDSAGISLAKGIEKTISQFTTSVKELHELNDKISKEERTLRFVTDTAKSVCETELIHLVNELSLYGINNNCLCYYFSFHYFPVVIRNDTLRSANKRVSL